MDVLKAKKKMFDEMGEFADEAGTEEMRAKYAPQPEVEEVAGTEDPEAEGMPAEGEAVPEDIEALLAKLSPEELEELLSKVE